jgi:hypothetical protein
LTFSPRSLSLLLPVRYPIIDCFEQRRSMPSYKALQIGHVIL